MTRLLRAIEHRKCHRREKVSIHTETAQLIDNMVRLDELLRSMGHRQFESLEYLSKKIAKQLTDLLLPTDEQL